MPAFVKTKRNEESWKKAVKAAASSIAKRKILSHEEAKQVLKKANAYGLATDIYKRIEVSRNRELPQGWSQPKIKSENIRMSSKLLQLASAMEKKAAKLLSQADQLRSQGERTAPYTSPQERMDVTPETILRYALGLGEKSPTLDVSRFTNFLTKLQHFKQTGRPSQLVIQASLAQDEKEYGDTALRDELRASNS